MTSISGQGQGQGYRWYWFLTANQEKNLIKELGSVKGVHIADALERLKNNAGLRNIVEAVAVRAGDIISPAILQNQKDCAATTRQYVKVTT